jgi:hypothetical protein
MDLVVACFRRDVAAQYLAVAAACADGKTADVAASANGSSLVFASVAAVAVLCSSVAVSSADHASTAICSCHDRRTGGKVTPG